VPRLRGSPTHQIERETIGLPRKRGTPLWQYVYLFIYLFIFVQVEVLEH
jgi:hypothetical protein